jgi:hypothetical protein
MRVMIQPMSAKPIFGLSNSLSQFVFFLRILVSGITLYKRRRCRVNPSVFEGLEVA